MQSQVWVMAGALTLCLACNRQPPPKPQPCTLPARVALIAGERINLDPQGEPLPTVVRVYQTTDSIRVEESDFEAIWERPDETLGDHLIKVQQVTMFPGTSETVDVSLDPKTKYLVGVAIFRRPTGTQWRALMPLPPSERLCARYKEDGAPDPAVLFKFDMYRVEAQSNLLRPAGDVLMPRDVAPDQPAPEPTAESSGREVDVSKVPTKAPSAPEAPGAPSTPEAPSAPKAPKAPEAPSSPY